jgi:hypothetical protein
MNLISFQSLSAYQCWWLWIAYWRLWTVTARLKLKDRFNQQSWLRSKLQYGLAEQPERAQIEDGGQLSEQLSRAMEMHEAVRLAARLHFIDLACLPKSIVLADMLNMRGDPATVILGVNKSQGELRSHAWVEVNGQMVSEPENVSVDFNVVEQIKH